MKHYLLLVAFVIFSSYLSQPSYGNDFSYEIHVRSSYSNGWFPKITCPPLAENIISGKGNTVHWSIKEGGYDHDTAQSCTISEEGNGGFVFTAFRGSWKLAEIIWEAYTFDDFIFDPQNGKRIYDWSVNEHGAYLHNYQTGKNELVVPKYNFKKILAEVFVSNLFDDGSKITLICVPKEASDGDRVAEARALGHKNFVGWSIEGRQYFKGKVQICHVGWKDTAHKTQTSSFTAFDDSWTLEEILRETYTRHDFTFNPYSRKHNYLWGVSGEGLSLYNFRAKEYQVLRELLK